MKVHIFLIAVFFSSLFNKADSKIIEHANITKVKFFSSSSILEIDSSSDTLKSKTEDSAYSHNQDTIQTKIDKEIFREEPGGFITLSSGIMFPKNAELFYGSLDMSINLLFVSDLLYLNAGGLIFKSNEGGLAAHITPGLGLYLLKDRIFAFAGAGLFFYTPGGRCLNFALRINYNISKQISVGVDNRFIKYGTDSNASVYIYSIGLNLSNKLNY